MQVENLDHLIQPDGVTVSELDLQDHTLGGVYVPAPALELDVGLVADVIGKLSIKSHADPVLRISFIRSADVAYPYHRLGAYVSGVELKLLERAVADFVCLRLQAHSGNQGRYVVMSYPGPALDYDTVHSAFDFKEARIRRVVGITADTQLESILLPFQSLPTQFQFL
jgi:hypothetical protein